MEIRNIKIEHIIIVLICCTTIFLSLNGCVKKTAEKLEDEKKMSQLTIQQAQEKHQNQLMALNGVVGVGIGVVNKEPVIKVLVKKKTPDLEKKIPKKLECYSVIIEETGEIRAF